MRDLAPSQADFSDAWDRGLRGYTENQGFPYRPVGAKTALDPDQFPTRLLGIETGYSVRRHARAAPTGGAGFVPISPFCQLRL